MLGTSGCPTCSKTGQRYEADVGAAQILIGLERAELANELAAIGEAPFRARQLWHWIYHRGVADFEAMTSLSRGLRGKLADRFTLQRPSIRLEQHSHDGTRKWLLRFGDGNEAETVFIPEEDRGASACHRRSAAR